MRLSPCLLLFGLPLGSMMMPESSGTQAPIAYNSKVEINGKIERVRIAPGQGTPSLEVRSGEKTVSVALGSMRYLLEQGFSPKAGEVVAITGFKAADGVIAVTVTLPATGKVLRLRDDAGRPVWTRGRRGAAANRFAK